LNPTGKAVADRAKLYDAGESGLRSQFQQAKAAVASQFDRRYNQNVDL
jgi:hypothetical protein